jgi:hypothetical protein
MYDQVTRGLFDALVRRAGGVEAVAAVLEARWGVGSKGTVSKMCSGHAGVTYEAIVAVEDFVGARPITSRMIERQAEGRSSPACLRELAAQSAMLTGVAHASLIMAFSDHGDGGAALTRGEAAEIKAKMLEVRELAGRIIAEAERAGGAV